MELDRKAIINGTSSKVIRNAYEALMNNFTKSSAFEFYNIYSTCDLSDILDNSRFIFCEPYRGLRYYRNIMETAPICRILDEQNKFHQYFEEFKTKMPAEQLENYTEVDNYMKSLVERYESVISLITLLQNDKDTIDNETYEDDCRIITTLYNLLDSLRAITDIEDEQYEYIIEKMSFLLLQINNLCFLPDIINIFCWYFELSVSLFRYIKDIYIDEPENLEDYCRDVYIINILKRLMINKEMSYKISCIRHDQLKLRLMEIAYTPEEMLLNKLKEKVISEDEIVYSGTENAVNDLFFGADVDETIKADDNQEMKEKVVAIESAILEITSDFLTYDIMTEDSNQDINSEYSLLGYYNESEGSNYSTFLRKDDVLDILMDKINYLKEEGIDFNDKKNKPSVTIKNKKDDDDEDNDRKDKKINEKEDYPKDKNGKPIKPKMSLNRKIQEKALDADIKAKKKGAKFAKFKQETKNTLKAIGKIPANILNACKKLIIDWDKMDDKRRKDYISKPGNRKKVFKSTRIALTYYVTAITAPLLTIVYFIVRCFSKEKDIRIRNELLHELDTEIKICDEKINDAASAGETKKKYELMRIKEKLEAEYVRVKTNSSYI